MDRRIVAAIGGNALGDTLPGQYQAAEAAAGVLAGLVRAGAELALVHGSGPQVGMIRQAMAGLTRQEPDHPAVPLTVCTAMAQGYVGYDLQKALRAGLLRRGCPRPVVTLLTQVEVDPADPAFDRPDKPIGAFLTEAEARTLAARGEPVMEDAGRGWRRAVASPQPKRVVELESIRALLDRGSVVVAGGGGGIPVAAAGSALRGVEAVVDKDHTAALLARELDAQVLLILTGVEGVLLHYGRPNQRSALRGVEAVVDKDHTAALLARELDAQVLLILTGVEGVLLHYGRPNQRRLTHMTVPVAEGYLAAGEFAAGSMAPKVAAGVAFARSAPGRRCVITDLSHADAALRGQAGTTIG